MMQETTIRDIGMCRMNMEVEGKKMEADRKLQADKEMEKDRKLNTKLKLSYYRKIAYVDDRHKAQLVQHTVTGKIFVLKSLKIYDMQVFSYLEKHHLKGMPKIIDLIEDDDKLCVIEEYISGISLRELMESSGPMTEREAVVYIDQLCGILRPLHLLNPPIVHRDIKPSNLIVTYDGSLVLVDFNSAKESQGDKSQDTVLFGTAGYAAPEQFGFSASRPTADIYEIGVLLNELLTGELPKDKKYKGPLSSLITKCTKMDPQKRYPDVDKLQKAMHRRQPGEKPESEPDREVNQSKLHSWMPPGFRGHNRSTMIISIFLYILLFAMCLTLEVENVNNYQLAVNRVFFLLIFLSETFFIGNYRNVWSWFPMTKSKNLLIKLCGVVLIAFLLLLCGFMLLLLKLRSLKRAMNLENSMNPGKDIA
jgi:serine/threonine protein kinase